MRLNLLRLSILASLLCVFSIRSNSQSCLPTNINGTVINLSCNQVCSTLVFQVPHLKSTEDYSLVNIAYNPYPYTTPFANEITELYIDDKWSQLRNIPFSFCFFGTTYASFVASSNGIITFDPSNAAPGCGSSGYLIGASFPAIPGSGGGSQCVAGSIYYPRASLMPNFQDLDPSASASPSERKIEWRVEGTAPCRKAVISFYKVGIWNSSCGAGYPNTFQVVLHESTGIIDFFTEQKTLCTSSSNNGRGIEGIQNWNRDKAVVVSSRNPAQWVATNEAHRFVPSGATSYFQSVQLLDMSGNLVATGDTLTSVAGLLDLRFTNFCTTAGSNQYVVKTIFNTCDGSGNQLVSLDTITINRTNLLNATASATAATCGPPDGTITVTVPAGVGTPPYTYTLDGGAPVVGPSPYTFTGVSSGPHIVTVTDASGGCTSTINITVTLSGTITETHTTTPITCSGLTNGSITIQTAGGLGPNYSFVLDGGAPVTGTLPYTFLNLASGSHNLIITDLTTGCNTGNLVIQVAVGPGITGNATSTPTSCSGVNNGTITVTATSGLAPFTWSLDGGAYVPGGNPFVFNGVAVGGHFVTIKDANNCTVLVIITVNAGAGVSGTASTTATSCPTATNGSITVTALTGTAPFTWSLDGGAFLPGASPYTFNGLASGPHTVTINDANNCSILVPATITAGSALTATTNTTASSCPSVNNGIITITSANGTGPYSFTLDGGAPQNGNIPFSFNNVSPGSHTIIVTDATGCSSAPIIVTVNAGPSLTATTTPTATSCAGAANGTISVSPVGGTSPFTYVIDGGAPQVAPGPFIFNNLAAGPHTITVTDASGCATNNIIETVPAGANLTTTVSTTAVLCNGDANGSMTVTVPAIGTPPFEYSLDGVTWVASNVFNGLVAGSYTAYYREANGCQGSTPFTITEPALLSASNTTVPVICNGQNNGIITITASGGVPPYQYSINGGASWVPSSIFNVPAGSYTVIIKDNNNCITTQNMTVTEPAALTGSAVTTSASCDGGNNGTITVTVAGGNNSYQYSIDGGATWVATNIFNVAPGTYTVDVKDALGCTTSIPATVGLGNNLTMTPQADVTICEGSSTQLNLVSNATAYAWTPATGLSSLTVPNPVANPIVSTQYIVTATLQRCAVNDTVNVFVNPAPVPDAGAYGLICFGQTYQLQGSGGVRYNWAPTSFLDNPNVSNPTATPTRTMIYTLSILADANGCPSLVTDTVTVDVTPPIRITTYPYDTILYENEQVQLLAVSAVPAANNFVWTPIIGLSNPAIPDPVLTAGPVGDVIQYKVTASSTAGCKGEGFVKVRVYKGPDLYVPTGFTPNGDGLNDRFYPFPVGIRSINYFRVYNRWGHIMFNSTTLYQGWDGKFSGVLQPSGVYVYMAEGVDKNGNKITKKGTITLIK